MYSCIYVPMFTRENRTKELNKLYSLSYVNWMKIIATWRAALLIDWITIIFRHSFPSPWRIYPAFAPISEFLRRCNWIFAFATAHEKQFPFPRYWGFGDFQSVASVAQTRRWMVEKHSVKRLHSCSLRHALVGAALFCWRNAPCDSLFSLLSKA